MTQWTHAAWLEANFENAGACPRLTAMQRLMTLENDGKLLFKIRCYAYTQLLKQHSGHNMDSGLKKVDESVILLRLASFKNTYFEE